MALSGSDKAYLQARSGIARSGAVRSNYFTPNVVVTIGGTNRIADIKSLEITLNLNDEPDTARFTLLPRTLYRESVLSDGPESYWRLNEASGPAADSAGSVTATAGGTLTYGQTGPLNDGSTAILFDGSSGALSAGDVYDFAGVVPFSVECWIKLASNHATAFVRIISKETTDGGGTQGWWMGVDPQSQAAPRSVFLIRRLNGSASELRSTTQLTIDTWTHVAATYDGTNMRIYVNGVLEGSPLASSLSMVDHAVALTIGRYSNAASNYLHGTLSDVAIWDRALTATEVAEHYAARTVYARPTVGQETIVGLGTAVNREFGGQILRTRHQRRPGNESPHIDVECIDWTRLFDRRLVTTYYENQSATAIVQDIVDTYTSGFTRHSVEAGLPTIEFLPAAMDTPSQSLRRIANMIGGGFYLDANKDLHFFGSAGETGTRRPTPPTTLINGLATLKRDPQVFTHSYDASQIRTRVFAETKGTQTLADVAVGQQAIPVADASAFLNVGGDALIAEYGSFSYGGRILYSLGSTVRTAAAVGATSIEVDDLGQIAGVGFFPGWVQINSRGQYIYYTGGTVTSSPAGNITGIPASGPGSLTAPLSVGDLVMNSGFLSALVGGANAITRTIPTGTYIASLVESNDTTQQTALAAIEGGDGIHESHLRDRRFNVDNGDALGDADLDAFSAATGLVTASWETEDMNARPGTRQVINLTGTDPLSVTLTITRVSLRFPVPNYPPRRSCEASTVRLASLLDVVQAEKGR